MFRKIGTILLIAAPILGFLFLFYFHYVPKTRENLNKQGFLILKQQKESMVQIFNDLAAFFPERIKKNFKTDLSRDSMQGRIVYRYEWTGKQKTKYDPEFIKDSLKLTSISYDHEGSEDNEINYNYRVRISKAGYFYDTARYIVSFKALAERLLEHRNSDYFSSYFITIEEGKRPKEDIHIIYNSPNLSVADEVSDSSKLLFDIQFSTIADLEINDTRYKAFLYPFQHNDMDFVLCGLIKDSEYFARQQSIPFETAYAVLLVLLITLIALPYLKIFILNPKESLKRRDLIFQAISFFTGTAILLLILHVFFMQIGTQFRTKEQLYQLSKSIRTSFGNELKLAYKELKRLDSSLNDTLRQKVKDWNKCGEYDSGRITIKPDTSFVKDKGELCLVRGDFINYTNAYWTDKKGNQLFKGRTDAQPFAFTNLSKRHYFKRVIYQNLFSIDDSVKSFTIEPVYSMTTNEFEVNLVVPGIDKAASDKRRVMAGISTRLSSVINTVTPYGFDFYIIERTGKILFQSNGAVTLKENFLDWVGENKLIKQAIVNRQSRYLSNEVIFDNSFNIRVDPIDQMPWYLVTLQNNDTVSVSYIHIIVFVLFFLSILYLLLFLCFVSGIMSLPVMKIYKLSSDRVKLVRPEKDKASFLWQANFYLSVYFLITVLYYSLVPFANENWMIGMIAPFFAMATLFHLFRRYYPSGNVYGAGPLLTTSNLSYVIFLLLIIGSYFLIDTVTTSGWNLFLFIVVSFIISMIRRPERKPGKPALSSYRPYYLFLFLSVLCFSILPTHFFYDYAQRKEIAVSMKKHQLDLAMKIERRIPQLKRYIKRQYKPAITDTIFHKILFKDGIYNCTGSYNCNVSTLPSRITNETRKESFPVGFFDLFVNKVIGGNISSDSMLTESDKSEDLKWQRTCSTSGSNLCFSLQYNLDPIGSDSTLKGIESLIVDTHLPGILEYYQANHFVPIAVVILMSILLLAGLFLSIKAIIKRIFPPPVIVDPDNGNYSRQDIVLQIVKDNLKQNKHGNT